MRNIFLNEFTRIFLARISDQRRNDIDDRKEESDDLPERHLSYSLCR